MSLSPGSPCPQPLDASSRAPELWGHTCLGSRLWPSLSGVLFLEVTWCLPAEGRRLGLMDDTPCVLSWCMGWGGTIGFLPLPAGPGGEGVTGEGRVRPGLPGPHLWPRGQSSIAGGSGGRLSAAFRSVGSFPSSSCLDASHGVLPLPEHRPFPAAVRPRGAVCCSPHGGWCLCIQHPLSLGCTLPAGAVGLLRMLVLLDLSLGCTFKPASRGVHLRNCCVPGRKVKWAPCLTPHCRHPE